ncbi:uncharacterized protein LOC106669409 [Cimex lectularius]|uniref:N-acetyltransferase domain-containing protein n=1 Tax=Cimex lectularius TaxID=79782 RepID=A0A8I6TKL9_CIMLE|nr:uncharacterized protein LOC106669409 [Cimex lectularius]XP_024083859.1 uncharacterized protein LOC106669409 [Cimex lectularius]
MNKGKMEFEEDPLQEIPPDDIHHLLATLKKDFPRSIHVYSFITILLKWKEKIDHYPIKIFAPGGNYKNGAIFFYIIFNCRLDGTLYTWTEEGKVLLAKSITETKRIQWFKYKIMFTGMPEDTWNAIEPLTKQMWKSHGIKFRTSLDKVFWLPSSLAKEIQIITPEGFQLGNLKEEHAELINNLWPHKHSESFKLIINTINYNFGLGVFDKNNHLVAWALYWFYGGIGSVHTVSEHRRKGLGKMVVNAITKKLGDLGIDVHLNVLRGNMTGESFFESIGFLHAYNGLWAYSQPDK